MAGTNGSVAVDAEAPDRQIGMAVAEGEIADLVRNSDVLPEWDTDAPLEVRLFRITHSIPLIENDDTNSQDHYGFVSRNAVVAHARNACMKHGVDWDLKSALDPTQPDGAKVIGAVTLEFFAIEYPKVRKSITLPAASPDRQCKGRSAMTTYGEKECLKKFFKIVTRDVGDDPDKYSSKDDPNKEAVATVDNAIQAWADSYRTALRNIEGRWDLDQLVRENADMMKSPDVPQATKSYFENMLAEAREQFPKSKK